MSIAWVQSGCQKNNRYRTGQKPMADIKFAEGLYYKEPNTNAPDFVKGGLSIQKEKLMAWLEMTDANEKGYINLDIKVSQSGKPYISINEWVPKNTEKKEPNSDYVQKAQEPSDSQARYDADDSVPF